MGATRQALSEPVVRIESPRFGTHAVPAERVIALPDGVVGFPAARRWALLEPRHPDAPFRYLLCIDQPELGFVVCEPEPFWPGYTSEVPRTAADSVVLVIVTVPGDPRDMTANLLAPLVLDVATRTGRQLVLDGQRWGTRHRVLPAGLPAAGASAAGT
jgi:flagellar assembly factor FliW